MLLKGIPHVSLLESRPCLSRSLSLHHAGTNRPFAAAARPVAVIDAAKTGALSIRFSMASSPNCSHMSRKGLGEMISDRSSSIRSIPIRNSVLGTPSGIQPLVAGRPGQRHYMDTDNAYSVSTASYRGRPHTLAESSNVVSRSGKEGVHRTSDLAATRRESHGKPDLGTQATDRQTITLAPDRQGHPFPLRFTAGADANSADLRSSGPDGWFRIGVVSLMPADNINGFRRTSSSTEGDRSRDGLPLAWRNMLRCMTGATGSGYRPPPSYYDLAWNTVEYNDVGTTNSSCSAGCSDWSRSSLPTSAPR